ncbi:MAG: DEAD/DEAH box helicase [Desulfobacterales bacterium]|nr:DEAD/DEAH box helicase [Desulfobacterales bacterium]MCP4160785.1 DEAD/DEAH box helicase [Deltaproteobacteria bacterium]
MSFKDLGLSTELLATIKLQGYTKPSPIQAQAIPEIFKGRDILGGAQTGTGKTAAFALPIIQNLSKNKPQKHRKPRALILTPTRELAAQVNESMCSYGRKTRLYTTEVYGGVNINPQIKRFRNGVDIVVATPGRLLDHLQRKTVDLTQIEFLVLDEADRMLDMGFINDIRKIVSTLPKKRQNLMFSATYSQSIKKLADTLLNNPVQIEVAKRNMATEMVTQYVHPVERGRKRELLSSLIRDEKWEQVLVFTRTKNGANRLTKQLMKDGIQAAAIHGNKSQSARTQALLRFKNGKVRTLVATDVAARGLDINLLPHVVNFDLPNAPEDYVHRIGRTGRAGQNGVALSLVCSEEQDLLVKIQRLLNKKITVKKIDGFQAEPATTKTKVNKRPKRYSASPKKQNRKKASSSSRSGGSVFSLAGQNKTRRVSGNA